MAKSKWIGKKLSNRYLIEDMLGQGGMSAVYKASDPNLKRVVAVKMIHTHLSDDPNFVQRFEIEASSVAQLRHHGIIQVYDFNKDDDTYYMVLEFVPGETFQDLLKRLNKDDRRLHVDKVTKYMAGICDAVDYAHQRGMIHRDIKPANLMLNTQDQAILMDFGIAKIIGGQMHTATGAVVGTAMYMSPEQIRGESPDKRSDIYSLGVTLFEMAGGQPPFQADSAMTLMMMHVNDPVPDLRKLNPDVPDNLIAIINKALAKDPNDRYQTAAQMATALRSIDSTSSGSASVDTPSHAGTMIEELSPATGPDKTTIEQPTAEVLGTVVETSPMPSLDEIEGTAFAPPKAQPNPPPPGPKAGFSLPVILGGLGVLGILIVGGIIFSNRGNSDTPTEEPPVVIVETVAPTERTAPEPTEEILPTDTPTETAIPYTATPETPYVVITNISLDGSSYVVDYELYNSLDGQHVHMFFNSVTPEQAGSPGSGPWKLTAGAYGPSPFRDYGPSNRPSNATQMCALVANGNHSINLNSGNCVDLP